MKPNMNMPAKQLDAIEFILNQPYQGIRLDIGIDGRTFDAMVRRGIIQDDRITVYGIQSYCVTILTKYDGATHERIHSALNNYQRLFG